MKLRKVKLVKRFTQGSSPHTVAALLNVPLSKVFDWGKGRDRPSKDQVNAIKKLNSPWNRLMRALSNKVVIFLEKYLLLVSENTTYPY